MHSRRFGDTSESSPSQLVSLPVPARRKLIEHFNNENEEDSSDTIHGEGVNFVSSGGGVDMGHHGTVTAIISYFNEQHTDLKRPVPLPRNKCKENVKYLISQFENATTAQDSPNVCEYGMNHDNLAVVEKNGDDDDDDDNDAVLSESLKKDTRQLERKFSTGSLEDRCHSDSNDPMLETSVDRSEEHSKEQMSPESEEKVIGVYIHSCDFLKIHRLLKHPLVKVHLLNANTGEYLKKSSLNKSVSYYHEHEHQDSILPLMTGVCDFKRRSSFLPIWEELLVFNEDINYILKDDPPVIIMFEIMDFLSFSIASSRYEKLGPESGWFKIAWAFLKPVGARKHLNIDKKLRLQLYKPKEMKKKDCGGCIVYAWWREKLLDKYPSTLYVTVKGITPPVHLVPAMRSKIALQQEITSDSILAEKEKAGLVRPENPVVSSSPKMFDTMVEACNRWSRLPAQSCKIPNKQKLVLPTLSKGCFRAKFSHSGLFLACSMESHDVHAISIFTIPDGKEHCVFVGHGGLIYDLSWSANDSFLLSASADHTACIWDVGNKVTKWLQILAHPSFVYCAQFHTQEYWLVATGCNDNVVRLWARLQNANDFELMQELEGHKSFITSLCFDQNGSLFSADISGQIFVWLCSTSQISQKNFPPWKENRLINLRELRKTPITKLEIHPGGRRLLVHARNNALRMLDIGTGTVIQWFLGAINERFQASSCISPCGSLVFAASEDGTVWVWNADTGEKVAVYTELHFQKVVTALDYHPHDHIIVCSSFGYRTKIALYEYDKSSFGTEIGLKLLKCLGRRSSVVSTSEEKPSDTRRRINQISTPASSTKVSTGEPQKSDFGNETTITCADNSFANNEDVTLSQRERSREENLALLIEKIDEVLSFQSVQKQLGNMEYSGVGEGHQE